MDLVEAKVRTSTASERHPWETARIAVVQKLIERYATLRRESLVIDVGCGDTFVVEQLARAYPDVSFYAVDTAFTAELIGLYRMKTAANVQLASSLDAIVLPQRAAASLVLLMDVIEHIADDRAFLRDVGARPYVAAGQTRFLITVPAYQMLFSSHDVFLGHYRRYSTRTLRRCLEASGLDVLASGYFFASLLPIRVLQVLRERLTRRDRAAEVTGVANWNGGALSAWCVRQWLMFDAACARGLQQMGITVPGLSHYAICRKSA
jgi:hypothetical protein